MDTLHDPETINLIGERNYNKQYEKQLTRAEAASYPISLRALVTVVPSSGPSTKSAVVGLRNDFTADFPGTPVVKAFDDPAMARQAIAADVIRVVDAMVRVLLSLIIEESCLLAFCLQ